MRRKDIQFAEKDQALRNDVRMLGNLIGGLIKEQGGQKLYNFVEQARLTAIKNRDQDFSTNTTLKDSLKKLEPKFAMEVIRSFSTYFQMANTAEKVHRIRRRRSYLQDPGQYQPGGMEETLTKLKANGTTLNELEALFKTILIQPVFTAHPTEPTRRTILQKEQRIVRQLIEMLNPTMTFQEKTICMENIKLEISTAWQTQEHPADQMTVADELEHILFFMTDVLYRVLPPLYEDMKNSILRVYGEEAKKINLSNILSFASWVGGDMDGNPNVNAKTIRETMARQRALILNLYYNECSALSAKLSQSSTRVTVNKDIQDKIDEYKESFPNAYHSLPPRHRGMPYRVLLRLIQERLQATHDDEAFPYTSASQFMGDIEIIAASLDQNKGQNAGLFAVNRLLRRISTFNFHLLSLDVRQNAIVHREVVGECLGESEWLQWSPKKRTQRISEALKNKESPLNKKSTLTKKTLAVFQAIAFCKRKYGKESIGLFIISMTQDIDDILSVLLLASWGDLQNRDGHISLDIVPLLETVSDLENGPKIIKSLMEHEHYCDHLTIRKNKQTVMIGYSDSNKDSGITSARWALQDAQIALVKAASKYNNDLFLFHGRGGTISRGGGKTHAAVLGSPPGTINGYLRVTEQGEIINEKYGLRGIALRTLEQATSSVVLASAIPQDHKKDLPEWQTIMHVIAENSQKKYRILLHQTPGFQDYFRQATPIDLIEKMRIGSRPSSRDEGNDFENLRAIPWVFAWTQNRYIIPGWFGFGSGIKAATEQFGEESIHTMFQDWYFMKALLSDIEMVLAKVDLTIANHYSMLSDKWHPQFSQIIEEEFHLTRKSILKYSGNKDILDNDHTLQRAIMLRNPYVDPMSLIQVDLLKRWRKTERTDEALFEALVASVNGIAQGLQNTG